MELNTHMTYSIQEDHVIAQYIPDGVEGETAETTGGADTESVPVFSPIADEDEPFPFPLFDKPLP